MSSVKIRELTADVSLDLDEEVAALVEYVDNRWEPMPQRFELFKDIRDKALFQARGWFSDYEVTHKARTLRETRETLLAPADAVYDAVCHFLDEVFFKMSTIERVGRDLDGPWDFSDRVSSVYSEMLKKYPGLANTRPLGWTELEKGYEDYDGMEAYDSAPDIAEFRGINSDSASAPGFHGRVVLPWVMYDEKCQGRKAPYVLVSAVFAHFLFIASKQNAFLACEELGRIANLQAPGLVFEVEWQPSAGNNPCINSIRELARAPHTKTEYEEHLRATDAFDALSEEEQEAAAIERDLTVEQIFAEILSEEEDPEEKAREAANAAKVIETMRKAFGA